MPCRNLAFLLRNIPQTFATLAAFALPLSTVAQGSLTPPGAPAPTMKSLGQIEPRRPIEAVPFVITTPGSYYVTTNLGPLGSGNGIVINASSVTIDMGGFQLVGSAASSNGIYVISSQTNITIRNGAITGWGRVGLHGAQAHHSQFIDLRVTGSGYAGLAAGPGSQIIRCVAARNQNLGMTADRGSTYDNCIAEGNFGEGISFVNGGVTVNNCTATGNTNYGFFAGGHGTLVNCSAKENGNSGFMGGRATRIVNCNSSQNGLHGFEVGYGCLVTGSTAADNAMNGFTASFRCVLKDNFGYANFGSGIRLTSGENRVEGNNLSENTFGLRTDAGGNFIIQNSASGNASGNYSITGPQTIGPIVSGPGTITTNNPWANFSF